MNSDQPQINQPDAGFDDAVGTAHELIRRLTDDLEARNGDRSAIDILRDTQGVLGRLSSTGAHDALPTATGQTPHLFFDVSDLLGYFEHNRLPTGIQRVQAELIFNILNSTEGQAAALCCFVVARDQWASVDANTFTEICAMSRAGGDPQEPHWRMAINQIMATIAGSSKLSFPTGAVLVNLGSSWWVPNYFLYIREAKKASNVKYIPLIYDLIPIVQSGYCIDNLVEEFIGWFIGVLEHADFYFAISEATKNDLIAFAEKLGRPIAPERIALARLDADFFRAETPGISAVKRFDEPFVLFVSTLEARKNQMGALDAWSTLIARYGAEKIPRLVLVGKPGFKSDQILKRLDSSDDLRERVTILSGIEDAELQALYRDCLFTIYPSFYEGWGLPVTESLCYGKVPLIADNSSLPEAGGTSALYFKSGSIAGLVAALELLILDERFRSQREHIIQEEFRPRGWSEIAAEITAEIENWATSTVGTDWQVPAVQTGAYYPMARNRSTRIWSGMGVAERFRQGVGWYRIEEWGSWTRPVGAELQFRLSENACRLGFELACPQDGDIRYKIEVVGHNVAVRGRIQSSHDTKWVFLDLPAQLDKEEVTIRITSTAYSVAAYGDNRPLGVGLKGFFILSDDFSTRMAFIEAAALGALSDLDIYRDRALDPGIN